jgi:hypothetical protein
MNRTCECELCRKARPSDWYLTILNSLDTELTRRGIATKIVFILYEDLLWPPEKERFTNPKRFAMMYAPISRRYSSPYYVGNAPVDLPLYRLNQNKMPSDEKIGAGFLRGWQRVFRGEAFAFDYHMFMHHYGDPGYYGFVEVMAEDIRRLPKMGMDGFVSCQVLRSYFPHGYPLYAHARLQWNPQQKTDDVAREYFAAAFGEGGEQVQQSMAKLSEFFGPWYLDPETLFGKDSEAKRAALRAKLAGVATTVADFRPVIARGISAADPSQRQSWKYLSLHADLVLKMAAELQARTEGNHEASDAAWHQIGQQVSEQEAETEHALDLYRFLTAYRFGRQFPPPQPNRTKPQ